jgi:putative transposase
MSAPDRRARLDMRHKKLSVRRQCALLGLARSGVDRAPRPAREDDAAAMRRIDALYTDHPFYGSRRIAFELKMSRKRVQRLMGVAALGPKPRTSKPAPGHTVFPYLLRGVSIERPNQVWAADITYVPVGAGFCYLVAIMDWASRAVLSRRLSNTIDASFCLKALEEALASFGKPEIFNCSSWNLI